MAKRWFDEQISAKENIFLLDLIKCDYGLVNKLEQVNNHRIFKFRIFMV